MKLDDYKSSLKTPLKERTLCFLVQDSRVLLGLKKSGFGKGNWIGIGGKVEDGESIEDAAKREIQEEINVTAGYLKRVGTLDFYFPYVTEPEKWNQRVCVFVANSWKGNIAETPEIKPDWFDPTSLPFKSMWADAPYWLPDVLAGKNLKAEFLFNSELGIEDYKKVHDEI